MDDVPEERQCPLHVREPWRELTIQHHGLQVRVLEEVPQLLLDVAEVDVDRDRTRLVRTECGLEPLHGVRAVYADVVAGLDAVRHEVVGDAVRRLVELAERATLGAHDERLAIRDRVDRMLEQVRDVVRHGI